MSSSPCEASLELPIRRSRCFRLSPSSLLQARLTAKCCRFVAGILQTSLSASLLDLRSPVGCGTVVRCPAFLTLLLLLLLRIKAAADAAPMPKLVRALLLLTLIVGPCRAKSSAGAVFACWHDLRPVAAPWCAFADCKSMAQCCCCRYCRYAALLLLPHGRLNANASMSLIVNLFIRSAASFASAARTRPVGGARFDALLRCYLKLLLLLHQVSCCPLAHASFASCAGAKLPHCSFVRWPGSSSSVCCPPSNC